MEASLVTTLTYPTLLKATLPPPYLRIIIIIIIMHHIFQGGQSRNNALAF